MKRTLDKIIEHSENEIKWFGKFIGMRAELTNQITDRDTKIRQLELENDVLFDDVVKRINLICDYEKVFENLKAQVRSLRDYKEHEEFDKPNTKLVYICSPLRGNIRKNQASARKYCKQAIKEGVIPIAPHIYLTQFLNDKKEDERNLGIKYGIELLKLCDELWVYGKPSSGMQKEIDWWDIHTNKPKIKKEVTK